MNSFAESAYGRRICLLGFAFCFKAENNKKSSGEMQMNPP